MKTIAVIGYAGRKIPMEDFCQLTERLTEQKYQGSYEQVAKAIDRHSSNPRFDVVGFYELVLFWIFLRRWKNLYV